MRPGRGIVLLAAVLAVFPASADARVRVTSDRIEVANGLVSRTWSRDGFRTLELVDRRGPDRVWSRDTPDFALVVAGQRIASDAFDVAGVDVARGGRRLTIHLTGVPGLDVERVVDLRDGVAGMRTQTILRPALPLPLQGVTLEQATTGAATPTVHAFRAGADWREPEWTGPQVQVGDPHGGTWRETHTAGRGEPLDASGEWLTLADGDRELALVAQGTDFPSARAGYDGAAGAVRDDYHRDVVSLGPFEEQGHVENSSDLPGRARVTRPGVPLALEPVWVGFGRRDGDLEWQWARELRHSLRFDRAVVFNSDHIDDNRISTGAKDDTDFAAVQSLAPVLRRLGADTFVLDDGWQAVSGDWNPDPKRFPDDHFAAVRDAIAPMKLGLWMSPMHFNPASTTFTEHPEWACQPYASGLYAYNAAQPGDGSNEAGIVPWGPAAIPYVESRIRRAIDAWGVRYFKFDFLAWLDCAGQGDFHDFRDDFAAMLGRLRADHPEVTFEIDETNDYRLFPYASTTHGPTWFQNGNPAPRQLLHNLWNLSPWVPSTTIGQHVLGGSNAARYATDTNMAAALLGHMTFYSDVRELPDAVVERARTWIDFYKGARGAIAHDVVYPLLDDPLKDSWTALQAWNPRRGGLLLAFRQSSADATRSIALRNVRRGRYELLSAPDLAPLGEVAASALRAGIDVTVPDAQGARVLVIRRL
jgi:hypothetical protein